MLTLLAVSLLCQPAPPDYGFVRAVEEFVIDAESSPGHAPPAIGSLIDGLGADCWRCRERAAKGLRRAGDGAVPWLIRGLRSPDAQVRLSCWLVLRDVAGCVHCRGTGTCREFARDPENAGYCLGCGWTAGDHDPDGPPRRCVRCTRDPGRLDMADLRF